MSWTSFLISFTSLSSELLTIVTTILLNSVSFSMLSPLGAITMGIVLSFSRGDMLFGFSLFAELGFAHLEFVG